MKDKSLNKSLRRANMSKNDEFYTQLPDIEKELGHYKDHFKNKVVLCNCDDPKESNFWKYFYLNFNFLGLKKLIATHFEKGNPSYKLEKTNGDTKKIPLKQNGDFRSPECIKILKEVDIVVTNPPFSLFREYVAQLIKYKKHFIILGQQNAISYKEIFKLIKENKIWLGVDNNGTKWFQVPNHYEITTESRKKIEDGKKFFSMGSIVWFTNLDIKKRHEDLILYKIYSGNESEYPKYDHYEAINVNKVTDIPMDYKGAIGVPITFLDKHNLKQFEIVDGIGRYSMLTGPTDKTKGTYLTKINGSPKFARIIIRNKKI